MNKSGGNMVTLSSLEEMDFIEEDVLLVSTTFGVTLYTDRVFTEIPDVVLYCYEKFLDLCPKENLKFYASENMKRHKPVNDRVFGMLQTWLKPEAPGREYISLELKDGKAYQDAPKYKFKITGNEKESLGYAGGNANLISFSFPPAWGAEEPDKMFDFVRDLCGRFPFQSGHAGFSFECCRYDEESSQTYAWQQSMHHPGIDVSRIPEDNKSAGQDALKTVNWLTILNADFIGKLGGLEAVKNHLPGDVDLIKVTNGYIFKAGKYPAIGDRNRGNSLPLYQSVYRVVAPLIEIACERSMAFDIADDFIEKTERWYKRFENE
jgi:hypothetical protein